MADGGDLTQEQTEKLVHFQELTGIDDIQRCRDMLERNNWDMEVAVQDTLSEQEGTASIFNEPPTPPIRANAVPQVDTNPIDQQVYVVNHRWPTGLFARIFFLVMWPFRTTFGVLWNMVGFAVSLFRPDPRTVVTDPLGDVLSFVRMFESRYGPVHPDFYHGTYSQALNEARRDLRFMLVYLHSDQHQDTDYFCRNTLCNIRVVELINSRLLFWACSVDKPEGYRVSQALKENSYPFLALIVLRFNRMTVVSRIEGPIDADGLITRLEALMENYEQTLLAARLEREERSFNQTLRDQQDEAYLESLRADQEKERLRQESLEREKKVEEDARNREQDELRRQEEIVRMKEELRERLPREPSSDDPDAVKILLKLPNGIRLERRFCKDDSLQSLHDYVFVHEAAPDDFQIVTNFPRRVLPFRSRTATDVTVNDHPCEPVPTFAEFGLGRSEMLFVHDNDA